MIRWEGFDARRDGHCPSWLFCYQTLVPLNKFVCKLYNVGGLPLHPIRYHLWLRIFSFPPIGRIRWEGFDARCDGHCPSWLFCYQTLVPLNKFVCKLYNVGGVPLHLNPLSFMVADFLLPHKILHFHPNCVIILYIKHHNTEVYHVRKF